MEYFKMNGKYSFYNVEKEKIFPKDEDINQENNQLEGDSGEKDLYSLFYTEGEKIIEEYCMTDGSCNLYRTIDDETLEVLYTEEYSSDLGVTMVNIYTTDKMFSAIKENDKIKSVGVMNAEDVIKLSKMHSELFSTKYTERHTNFLMYDFKVIANKEDEKILEEFRKKYLRYKASAAFIPASAIIDEIEEMADKYMKTGEIDREELTDRYVDLQNFQEFCSNSIEEIAPFVNNPQHTDIPAMCKEIKKNMENMDKLTEMYLSEELKEDEKGEEREI